MYLPYLYRPYISPISHLAHDVLVRDGDEGGEVLGQREDHLGEMQARYGRDAGEIQARYAGEVWWRYRRGVLGAREDQP